MDKQRYRREELDKALERVNRTIENIGVINANIDRLIEAYHGINEGTRKIADTLEGYLSEDVKKGIA